MQFAAIQDLTVSSLLGQFALVVVAEVQLTVIEVKLIKIEMDDTCIGMGILDQDFQANIFLFPFITSERAQRASEVFSI